MIEPSGNTRWTEISCEDGSLFQSKIEGLSLAPGKPSMIRFVIDDDDENAPSEMFEAEFPALGFERRFALIGTGPGGRG